MENDQFVAVRFSSFIMFFFLKFVLFCVCIYSVTTQVFRLLICRQSLYPCFCAYFTQNILISEPSRYSLECSKHLNWGLIAHYLWLWQMAVFINSSRPLMNLPANKCRKLSKVAEMISVRVRINIKASSFGKAAVWWWLSGTGDLAKWQSCSHCVRLFPFPVSSLQCQEWCTARTVPVHQKIPTLHGDMSEPSYKGAHGVIRPHF